MSKVNSLWKYFEIYEQKEECKFIAGAKLKYNNIEHDNQKEILQIF